MQEDRMHEKNFQVKYLKNVLLSQNKTQQISPPNLKKETHTKKQQQNPTH